MCHGRMFEMRKKQVVNLSFKGKYQVRKTAIFDGKANMQDITNPLLPISLGGNLTLHVTMTDRGEPGSSDQIGVTVYNSSGGILYSSDWDGVKTSELYLKGGNILVSNSTTTTTQTPITSITRSTEKASVINPEFKFDVSTYPNPAQSQFNIKLQSSNTKDPISIIVYGMNGKVVETKQNLKAGQSLVLGGLYRPGIYVLEMIQGNEHKQLKLVKIPD